MVLISIISVLILSSHLRLGRKSWGVASSEAEGGRMAVTVGSLSLKERAYLGLSVTQSAAFRGTICILCNMPKYAIIAFHVNVATYSSRNLKKGTALKSRN
jgi:hypothetical protein